MPITEKSRPRLRPLELKWIEDGPQPVLFLRDPSGIAPNSATVPQWVAVILSFCDGSRDLAAIRAAFEQRTGQNIPIDRVQDLMRQLDDALFLDSPRFTTARERVIREYRAAVCRLPALADRVYPSDPTNLIAELKRYGAVGDNPPESTTAIRGIVSPHIDYQRGGPIYARTWRLAEPAVNDAEVVVIFGTDHAGGAGKVTLTRQSFGTPLGVLPTAVDVVEAVADAIGADNAFEEEIHHAREHSIELAAVWLHAMRRGAPPRIVPILCGSFYEFTHGDERPDNDSGFAAAIAAIQDSTRGQRVLVVAAADLAHVGPAFGDTRGLDRGDRDALAAKDRSLLDTVASGDAEGFYGQLRAEQDSRRICGLPPIYLTLRLLGSSRGQVVGYDQCAADPEGGSLVSIAGVLLE